VYSGCSVERYGVRGTLPLVARGGGHINYVVHRDAAASLGREL
jgi:hypothetical protein